MAISPSTPNTPETNSEQLCRAQVDEVEDMQVLQVSSALWDLSRVSSSEVDPADLRRQSVMSSPSPLTPTRLSSSPSLTQIDHLMVDLGDADEEGQTSTASYTLSTPVPRSSHQTSFDSLVADTMRTFQEDGSNASSNSLVLSLGSEGVGGQSHVSVPQILSQTTSPAPAPKPLESQEISQTSEINVLKSKEALEGLKELQDSVRLRAEGIALRSTLVGSEDIASNSEQPSQRTPIPQLILKFRMNKGFLKKLEEPKFVLDLVKTPLLIEIWVLILRELYFIQARDGMRFSVSPSFWKLRLVSQAFNAIITPLACRHMHLDFLRTSRNVGTFGQKEMSSHFIPYQSILYYDYTRERYLRHNYIKEITTGGDVALPGWDAHSWLPLCNKSVLLNFVYPRDDDSVTSSDALPPYLVDSIKERPTHRLRIQNCTLASSDEKELLESFPAENLVGLELFLHGTVFTLLQELLVSATKLETLKLSLSDEAGGKFFFLQSGGRLPPVKDLYLQGYDWPFTSRRIDGVWDFSKLQYLTLDGVCIPQFLTSVAHIDFSKLKTLALRDVEARYSQQMRIVAGLRVMLANPVYLEKLTVFFRKSAPHSGQRDAETILFEKLTQTTSWYPDEVNLGRIHVNRGVKGAATFWDALNKALPAGLASSSQ